MSNCEITIVHLAPPQITSCGDFVYRLKQPDYELGRLPGVVTASITNICSARLDLIRNADVLIIQLLGDPDLLSVIMERRQRRLSTVFEISDNFMDFQPHNPAARFYEVPENRACILQLISQCDAIQVTVPPLAEKYSRYNRRVRVFQNRMSSLGKHVGNNMNPVVGWGGSFGHYEDVREAAPYITDWIKRHPDVIFSLMGDSKFATLFSDIPKHQFRYRLPGDIDYYYDFVQSLDIGLVIARDDEFNLCRSDVKFMEYASRAVVPVCSDIPTYNRTLRHGETGLLFSDYSEMTSQLDRLVADKNFREQIAENAFNYIKNERMEAEGARERLEFYQELICESGGRGSLTEDMMASLPSLKKSEGSSHYLHEISIAENAMYNGMISQFTRGDQGNAAAFYRDALDAEPDSFLANFYFGVLVADTNPGDAEIHLGKAHSIWPGSCEVNLKAALLQAQAGNVDKTISMLDKLKSDHPSYAPAHMALGNYYFNSGDYEKAYVNYKAALAANPYFEPAMVKLGAIMTARNELVDAESHYRDAIEISPRDATARAGLAAIEFSNGKFAESAHHFNIALDSVCDAAVIAADILNTAKKLYANKKYEIAISLLKNAEMKIPGNADILFWLARAQEKNNDTQGARDTWRKLLLADPEGRYSKYI